MNNTGNPNWVKGCEGPNPKGRPKGSKNRFSPKTLEDALKKAQDKHGGVSLIDHLCGKAYEDNKLAVAILKKMYPDLKQIEALIDVDFGGYAGLTPAESAAEMDAATVGDRPTGTKPNAD